jgi:DNA-binding response OmpR family regulator
LDNTVLNLRRLFEHDSKNPSHLHTVRGVGMRFTKEREEEG